MREVRKLERDQLRAALDLAAKAYPMLEVNSEQKLDGLEARIGADFNGETRQWYGLFEDDKLLGNMVLYDFTVDYYGQEIKARGIGFVAVEFLHKKQKVCREMLQWYLRDSLKLNYPLAMLYAFRPDFYQKMGFGFGTGCYNYVTKPECFPRTEVNHPMIYLGTADKDEVIAFYRELYQAQHGMIPKKPREIEQYLEAQGVYRVGYREGGKLHALLTFRLVSNESPDQSTHMKLDLLFSDSLGLRAALNFLHSQSDQVSEISISTPFREFFYNLTDIRHQDHRILKEPGYHHTYDAGMGIMYRSLDPVALLLKKPCTLDKQKVRFVLRDSFMEECAHDFVIEWKEGKALKSRSKKADLTLSFGVSDFSSWVMNAIDLETLYLYGLVEISDETVLRMIDRAFYYPQKPMCLERF